MEHLEFLQETTLRHSILMEILITKVGQQVRDSISILDLLSLVNFPTESNAVR